MIKPVELESLIVRQEGFPFFSRELIAERQLELLNFQLRRAKSKSGFYRDYPDSLSSLEELSSIPFTTAENVRADFSRLCLVSPDEFARLRTELTSGTSGPPKRMAYSHYDCMRTLAFFENGLGELVFPGDRVLICMPFTDSLSLGGLIAEAIRRLGARPVIAGVGKSFGEYINTCISDNANVYIGPSVLLLSLLRLSPLPLKRALVSGDHCAQSVRLACEAALGSRLFPHYGLRESGLGCALTCSAHEGLHVRENDIICEIISESGTPLPVGQWGELVITTIGMDAMPLFRYRTGDFARILPGVCPCGSSVLRIEVTDRIQNGIGIGFYDELLFGFDEIVDFSISGRNIVISVTDENENLKQSLSKVLRSFSVSFRRALLTDTPMYISKRRIL
jgi:phenylacetate-CoA ligase